MVYYCWFRRKNVILSNCILWKAWNNGNGGLAKMPRNEPVREPINIVNRSLEKWRLYQHYQLFGFQVMILAWWLAAPNRNDDNERIITLDCSKKCSFPYFHVVSPIASINLQFPYNFSWENIRSSFNYSEKRWKMINRVCL
jgi:hypothetical protein